jgi:hypothetical protein
VVSAGSGGAIVPIEERSAPRRDCVSKPAECSEGVKPSGMRSMYGTEMGLWPAKVIVRLSGPD